MSDAYEDLESEYGFLIEATGMFPGLIGAIFPCSDGTTHKQLMQSCRSQALFITVARDHGSGEVVLDDLGRAVMRWGLGDEVDRRLARGRTWRCAGCTRPPAPWTCSRRTRRSCAGARGDDFEEFVARVDAAS